MSREFDRGRIERKSYFCAPFVLQRTYEYLGRVFTLEELESDLGTNPTGTDWESILTHIREEGYPHTVRYQADYQNLIREFEEGKALIVDRKYRVRNGLEEHVSFVNYISKYRIQFAEINLGTRIGMELITMPRKSFERLWYSDIGRRAYIAVERRPRKRSRKQE